MSQTAQRKRRLVGPADTDRSTGVRQRQLISAALTRLLMLIIRMLHSKCASDMLMCSV